MTSDRTRWAELTGGTSGADYAARFAALAATGVQMHGEAAFCAALVEPPARVLDAGCGTGRVAIRLADLGFDVVGTDLDSSMLDEARRQRPDLSWQLCDLADLPPLGPPFDLVVAAGNVIPLLAPGTLDRAVAGFAAQLAPGAALVTGFGLDAAHLPKRCPVTELLDFDGACADAGLSLQDRYATWSGDVYPGADGGYAVSVHRSTR